MFRGGLSEKGHLWWRLLLCKARDLANDVYDDDERRRASDVRSAKRVAPLLVTP